MHHRCAPWASTRSRRSIGSSWTSLSKVDLLEAFVAGMAGCALLTASATADPSQSWQRHGTGTGGENGWW